MPTPLGLPCAVACDMEEDRGAPVGVQQFVLRLGRQDRQLTRIAEVAASDTGPQFQWLFLRQQADVKRYLQDSPLVRHAH